MQVRVVAAMYAQDPAEWERLRTLVARCADLDPLTGLLYDVLADLPATAPGLPEHLGAHLAELTESALPGHVAELCRAAAWLDQLHEYRHQFARLVEHEKASRSSR